MKVLAGVYKCDEGEIYLESQRVQIEDPSHSRALGINVVYQELELISSLSVAENIFLGNEAVRGRVIDWKKTEQSAEELLLSLGIEISARRKVEGLSIAQQQLITIAKAVSRESKVIIMDEPSAVLSGKSLDLLFRTIKQLREKDISVVFISHHLAEVYEVGDRVTVMRDAKNRPDQQGAGHISGRNDQRDDRPQAAGALLQEENADRQDCAGGAQPQPGQAAQGRQLRAAGKGDPGDLRSDRSGENRAFQGHHRRGPDRWGGNHRKRRKRPDQEIPAGPWPSRSATYRKAGGKAAC